mgnify:CR=1 FL=1
MKKGGLIMYVNESFILEKDDLSKVLVIYQSTINVDSFNLLNEELKKTFKNLTVISSVKMTMSFRQISLTILILV